VLFNLAAESSNHEDFVEKARSFFQEDDPAEFAEWKTAVSIVTRENTTVPGLQSLPGASNMEPSIEFTSMQPAQVRPELNPTIANQDLKSNFRQAA
jgi:hypothetical protein